MSEITRKVYEITEDLRRDILSEKLRKISPKELGELHKEICRYYRDNIRQIISEIENKGVKVQYIFPSIMGSALGDPAEFVEFSKKAVLYADVLLFEDPMEYFLRIAKDFRREVTPEILWMAAEALENLKPLVEKNLLIFYPRIPPTKKEDFSGMWSDSIKPIIRASKNDKQIIKSILKTDAPNYRDLAIKVIRPAIKNQQRIRAFQIDEVFSTGLAFCINSVFASSNFFSSELALSNDVYWKCLNAILDKRRPRTLVQMSAQALGSIELPFLQGADLETILKVREEHADHFGAWRKGWRDACSGLERINDPSEFNKELERIRTDIIDPNLKRLDKWRGAIRPLGVAFKGLGVVPVTIGAFFGNLPLNLIGAASIEPLALEYGGDLAKWIVDKQMRRNFVYFLWEVKEAG